MSFFTTYSSLLLPLLAATVLLSSSTDAFFILSHPKTLVHTRLDPIVNPGQISGHMHNVVGANSFNRSYDLTLQREATCTTSPVQADLSTYWAPQLYYQAENGSLTIVPTAFVQTYYLNRNGPKKQKIKAFPPGLRMLAGDPKRTTFNASLFTNTAISFVCLDYAGGHDNDPAWAQRNSFFEHDCPDGQRLQINFPSCWNGVDLDSTDHKSHMSYPIQNVDGGDCPDSHPIQLVSLFYEFVYQTNLYPYREGAFVLATGDTTGYGNHADFADGWDTTVLQNAIDTCPDDTSGNIEICPALAASIDRSKQQACQPVNEVVDEDTGLGTWLSSLPGNNPVKDSSGQAINSASKTDYTETATFISPAGVLPGGWKAEGCFTEGIGARALQGFSLVNEAMTIEICLNACKAEGFAFAGLEFGK
ncbi:WSC-domain-containing protein [Mrakia frigida]|uniref:WSC-domain-containing protein n=1 Tax=Mrakia frigida TaxID=29902 RepID=UPI003FCBFC34